MMGVKNINEEKAFDLLEEFCKGNTFFSDFTDENMDSLLHYMDVIHFKTNDVLMKQGEEATWAGFILEGTVDVLIGNNPTPVAQMKKNDTVGEM